MMTKKLLTTIDLAILGAVAQFKERVYKEEAEIDCHYRSLETQIGNIEDHRHCRTKGQRQTPKDTVAKRVFIESQRTIWKKGHYWDLKGGAFLPKAII
jgi:hypothetical protein